MTIFEPYRNEPYSSYQSAQDVAAYQAVLERVRSQLGQSYPIIIGADTIDTGDYLESINPCQLDMLIGRSAKAEAQHVEQALVAAWEAYREWSQWPMASRARAVMKLAAIMRRRKLELSAWMTFEAGKNYAEAEADTAEAIDFCEYYARKALDLTGIIHEYDYPGEENSSFLIPIGAGVVIPPWNFPLAILCGMAVGPVVVGNTVVVKPAPSTPVIAQKFMECVKEAGFPPGVINLLTGDDAVLGDALVDHPKTRFINFTGSLATGLRINERAAKVHKGQKWLKKVYCELGGKDALIVDETADLDYAASMATASAFGFQGQKCSAMSRLIVVQDVYEAMLERFAAKTRALTQGAAEDNANVAAVINERAVEKIMHYIGMGKDEARLIVGGERAAGNGYYIQPTIFADVTPEATIACEEIFGPVIAVIKAKDFDHALSIANSTPYGLTGGLISQSRERLERARREFMVGNLYLNRKITGALVGTQPFGGFYLSGSNAKAGGPDYLRLFMEMKTVSERF